MVAIWSVVWVLVGVGVLLCALQWWLHAGEDARHFSRIPGPPGLPIIGNGLDILLDRVSLFTKNRALSKEFPEIYKAQILEKRFVLLQNPTDIETVLTSPKHKEKGYLYSFLRPWLGEGLLTSDGEKWHSRRKILTPTFHFNILRQFSFVLEENSRRLVRRLRPELRRERTDVTTFLNSHTLNNLYETALGTRLEDEISTRYTAVVAELIDSIVERFSCFWLHPAWTFNLSSLGRRHRRAIEEAHSFSDRVIEERRRDMQQYGCAGAYAEGSADEGELRLAGGRKRMAMLDLLLSAEREGLIDTAGVQEEVDTFMFGGHDTTSTALTFMLLCLANFQDIQGKVVAELDSIFGGSQRPATMADLLQMKYLECCIKETMRLYSPIPYITRRLGVKIQLKDYVVPAGTQCHINIFELHRRADLFHEPLQFRPERFLSGRGDSRHPYAYIPFSAGPRNCIGQEFALLEIKSDISAILRTYELQPVIKPEDIVFIIDIVLRSHNPVYVKFVSRKKCQKFALLEIKSDISAILRTYELQPVTKPEDIVFIIDIVLRSHNPVYVKFLSRNVK